MLVYPPTATHLFNDGLQATAPPVLLTLLNILDAVVVHVIPSNEYAKAVEPLLLPTQVHIVPLYQIPYTPTANGVEIEPATVQFIPSYE